MAEQIKQNWPEFKSRKDENILNCQRPDEMHVHKTVNVSTENYQRVEDRKLLSSESNLQDDGKYMQSYYPSKPNFQLRPIENFILGQSPPKVYVAYSFGTKMTNNNEHQPLNRVSSNVYSLKYSSCPSSTNKNRRMARSLAIEYLSHRSSSEECQNDPSATLPQTSILLSRERSPSITGSISTETATESRFGKSLSPMEPLTDLDLVIKKVTLEDSSTTIPLYEELPEILTMRDEDSPVQQQKYLDLPLMELNSLTNTTQTVLQVDKNHSKSLSGVISWKSSNTSVSKIPQKALTISTNKPIIGGYFRDKYSARNKSLSAMTVIDTQSMFQVKSGPTKVFSGTRSGYFQPLTLKQSTVKFLSKNLDSIGFVGSVPYTVLRTVLQKMSVTQLNRFENQNRQLIPESDELWCNFVKQAFRYEGVREGETWRQMYRRCSKENGEKLKKIAENIKKSKIPLKFLQTLT